MKFTPERALIIRDVAVIADLHLGIENAMVEKGISIPRMQIDEIIERINSIVDSYGVREIVIAGDLKHEFCQNLPYEWEDVELLLKSVDVDLRFVRGNHDNFLKTILARYGMTLEEELEVYGWTVVHGHRECERKRIVMGHEHPSIKVRINGIHTFHCFLRIKKDEREIIVLPAFSPLVSGSDVSYCRFLSPILKDVKEEEVEVFAIEEDVFYLGKLVDLKEYLAAGVFP